MKKEEKYNYEDPLLEMERIEKENAKFVIERKKISDERKYDRQVEKQRNLVRNLKIFTAAVALGTVVLVGSLVGKIKAGIETGTQIEIEESHRIIMDSLSVFPNKGEGIIDYEKRISKAVGNRVKVDYSETNGVLYEDRGYPIENYKLSTRDSKIFCQLNVILDNTESDKVRNFLSTLMDGDFVVDLNGNLKWDDKIVELNRLLAEAKEPLYRVSSEGLVSDGVVAKAYYYGENVYAGNIGQVLTEPEKSK